MSVEHCQNSEPAWFSQASFRCRLDWGQRGAAAAAARGDLLVVIDVLSFSTVVATATHRGVAILPCFSEAKQRLAKEVGAAPAVKRAEVPRLGRFSPSPETYLTAEAGTAVALDSLNRAACVLRGRGAAALIAASFVNAEAVAAWLTKQIRTTGNNVTILACGEHWPTPFPGEEVRFALEDYLGAGAVLSYLDFDKSPECQVCEAGFRSVRDRLEQVLLHCGSGIELRDKGYATDVRHAARLNLYDVVPILEGAAFVNGRI